jgi:tetratricopeptide (TPR) repeat protein
MANSARIDELRKKFDENPRRYFAPLANEYRKAGDLEQAIFICQEYLPQQPGHMSGHIVYGQALFEMARMDEAQVVFETALLLDPENLIALRHLGDITRHTGDLSGARIWYQRVLEADPRNEEIAQIMLAILVAPVPSVDPRALTPRTSPAVSAVADEPPPRAEAESPPARPAADESTGFIVEKSEESALPSSPEVAPPPPLKHESPETKAIDGHDFLDLNDFSLGGVPLGSIKSAEPELAGPSGNRNAQDWDDAPESAPSVEGEFFVDTPITAPAAYSLPPALSEPEESGGFTLGQEDGPFELDSFAIAAGSAQPPIELATDINLGLPDDGTSPDMSSADLPVIQGLETFEAGAIADMPDELPSLGAADFFEAGSSSHEAEPAAAPPAFVTETMAELYLQQGHLESALDIYTQLVEQRPGDDRLRERLEAVEQRLYGQPAVESTVEPDVPPVPVYGGPTIREFLNGLVARRATPVADVPEESVATAVATVDGDSDERSEFGSAMAPTARHTPSSSETVSGSIDALFSGADASSADVNAASTLQEAFAPETAETTPLQGMPARRASSELSLDHVFKGNAPPPADADGFSFDQFFAEEMSDPAPSASGEGSARAGESTDDIAQFNAWLNGLKKT